MSRIIHPEKQTGFITRISTEKASPTKRAKSIGGSYAAGPVTVGQRRSSRVRLSLPRPQPVSAPQGCAARPPQGWATGATKGTERSTRGQKPPGQTPYSTVTWGAMEWGAVGLGHGAGAFNLIPLRPPRGG